jgi:hypothetical protein
MLRGLGFAEYVVGAFEKSAVFYWRMWGPLGGPMIRATEQWADMQRRYLRSLRREGPAAAPRGAAADGTTPAPEEGPREEIRSIIRESVRRSQEGVRGEEEEPQDGTTPAPEEGSREEIRSIIRESVRRSEEGVREEEEEPQDGTTPAPKEGRADAEEPPVEDYDSLSVGQVNQRLLELSVEEVEQLRDYEAAHRNRPSIMNRYERRLRVARENREGGGAAGAAESSAGGEG